MLGLLEAARLFVLSPAAASIKTFSFAVVPVGSEGQLELDDATDKALGGLLMALAPSVVQLHLTCLPPKRSDDRCAVLGAILAKNQTITELVLQESLWLVRLLHNHLSASQFPRLTSLGLSRSSGLTYSERRTLMALLTMPKNQNIAAEAEAGEGGALIMQLKSLDLSHMNFDSSDLGTLCVGLEDPSSRNNVTTASMTRLVLSGNHLDDAALFRFSGAFLTRAQHLRALELRFRPRKGSVITRIGYDALCATLGQSCPALEELNLKAHDLPPSAVMRLADAQLTNLSLVEFSCRSPVEAWWPALLALVAASPQLSRISLSQSNLKGIATVRDIQKMDLAANKDDSIATEDLNPFDPEYMTPSHLAAGKVPTHFEIARRDAEQGRTQRFVPPARSDEVSTVKKSGGGGVFARNLRVLELSETGMSDADWLHLTSHCGLSDVVGLERLDLSGNVGLTMEVTLSLRALLASNATSLKDLDISGLVQFGEIGMVGLLEPLETTLEGSSESPFGRMRNLRHLRLHGGTVACSNSLAWLAEAVPGMTNLQTIYLGGPRPWWTQDDLQSFLDALVEAKGLSARRREGLQLEAVVITGAMLPDDGQGQAGVMSLISASRQLLKQKLGAELVFM